MGAGPGADALQMTTLAAHGAAGSGDARPVAGGPEQSDGAPGGPSTVVAAGDQPSRSLPLVALVLGIAGVALGLTAIWFFAAIPTGAAAVVVGGISLVRLQGVVDPRARGRAVIGTVLGAVAVLLGVMGAIFLPQAMDRMDRFLDSVQADVNDDVALINSGLQRDVDQLDRTLTRDLKRFEAENRRDLRQLEDRSTRALEELEQKLGADVAGLSRAARQDLTQLEQRLRTDVHALDAALRGTESSLRADLASLTARVERLERDLAAAGDGGG
jgi:F0F1-type ATP synthase membrane subunit b/b'